MIPLCPFCKDPVEKPWETPLPEEGVTWEKRKCPGCWVRYKDEVYYSYTPYPESILWDGPASMAENLIWEPTVHPMRAQIEIRVIHGYNWKEHEVDEEFSHFEDDQKDGHLYFVRRRREGEGGRLDIFPEEYKRKQLSRLSPEELNDRFVSVVIKRHRLNPTDLEAAVQHIFSEEKIEYIVEYEEK